MQKNRIVLGITAIVVIALLYVGAGYAFSGDARTYNPDDEQKLAYMTVDPGDFDPIFTGDSAFSTYIYDADSTAAVDKKTAYAFADGTVTTPITVNAKNYTAALLGTKTLTVTNHTSAAITKLNFDISASGNTGNADFVYIFGVTIGTADEAFTVFEGTTSSAQIANYVAAIAVDGNVTVTLKAYIGYVPNVVVPTNYIGPAVTDMNAEGHKYIQPTGALVDLSATSFGIKVTDATPVTP